MNLTKILEDANENLNNLRETVASYECDEDVDIRELEFHIKMLKLDLQLIESEKTYYLSISTAAAIDFVDELSEMQEIIEESIDMTEDTIEKILESRDE